MTKTLHHRTLDIYQDVWEKVRVLKTFKTSDIVKDMAASSCRVDEILGRMEVAGYLSVNRKTKPYVWTLIKDAGRILPVLTKDGRKKAPSMQDKVWMASKATKCFTVKDMAFICDANIRSCQNYINLLEKAGYLRVQNKKPGQTSYIYSFVRKNDTGPLSPSILRGETQIYDRNTQKIVWQKPEASNDGGAE